MELNFGEYVQEKYGMSPTDYLNKYGEEKFDDVMRDYGYMYDEDEANSYDDYLDEEE